MVPDLCKSPGRFIRCSPDPSIHFGWRHVRTDMAKIIELLSRVRFSFPRLVSNREGLAFQDAIHHFIKTLFYQVITALRYRIDRVSGADGETFYLDNMTGIHSRFHMMTGDAVFFFVVIKGKVGAAGAGVFRTARMKINRGYRGTFQQTGRVDPGRYKRDQEFAFPVQDFGGQFVFAAAGKNRGLWKMGPDILLSPGGIFIILFPKE